MNSSLHALDKNLSDDDFKCLSQEISGDFLELVDQTGVCPYEQMDSFKKFFENKLPDRCDFFSSLKDECISEKDYSLPINVWNSLKIDAMGDYHNIYEMFCYWLMLLKSLLIHASNIMDQILVTILVVLS